jgi:hypothetical protein
MPDIFDTLTEAKPKGDVFDTLAQGTSTPEKPADVFAHLGHEAAGYETKLAPEEEPKFQEWKAKVAPKDSGQDYDWRGFWKAGSELDKKTGHGTDKFKKPNHPTFSDQSQYSTSETPGGKWGKDESGKDTFTPSQWMTKDQQRAGQLKDYFKVKEPEAVLLPNDGETQGRDALKQFLEFKSTFDMTPAGFMAQGNAILDEGKREDVYNAFLNSQKDIANSPAGFFAEAHRAGMRGMDLPRTPVQKMYETLGFPQAYVERKPGEPELDGTGNPNLDKFIEGISSVAPKVGMVSGEEAQSWVNKLTSSDWWLGKDRSEEPPTIKPSEVGWIAGAHSGVLRSAAKTFNFFVSPEGVALLGTSILSEDAQRAVAGRSGFIPWYWTKVPLSSLA